MILTLYFAGGDACKNGTHTRSTRINLFCNSVNHEPILIEETDTCEYVFNWLTSAACPRHVTTGTSCKVLDPLYENLYDLNPLRNPAKDYAVAGWEHRYLINLCDPLVSSCHGEGKSGVCQVKDGQEFSGGLATNRVTFNDGTLMMNFNNGTGDCEGNNTRSSQIIFLCDHEESGANGLQFIHEDETCTYHFIWRTKHACPPFHVVDCVLIQDGLKYDLRELSSPNMNEEYFSTEQSQKYVLNVCRTVIHSKGSRCSYDAGACVIDLKHENKSINIGRVQSGPYMENGTLKLKYTDGDQCKLNLNRSETIIEFVCDTDTRYPYPQLIGQEDCKYLFEWKTQAACPVSVATTTLPTGSAHNCTVSNPITQHSFDLNSLKKEDGYEIHDDHNLHLILNICAEVKTGTCPSGTGACSYSDNNKTNVQSAGEANADLQYLSGFLFLNYAGGSQCNNTVKRSTFISFICGAENKTEGPVLIHDDVDRCTYFVNWYTELACERRINCFVDAWDRRIDLSPLIRTTDNYKVVNPRSPNDTFYLNVCRPLNPISGINCQPGTAGCLSNPTLETGPASLGHPVVTPVYIYKDQVNLLYTHGSNCTSNPSSGYSSSTRIQFVCNKSAGQVCLCQHCFDYCTLES